MSRAREIVQQLLAEALDWRKGHKVANRQIEAAGASIRIKALEDVLAGLELTASSTPQ